MDDVIKVALDRFKESQDGDDFNRSAFEEDVRFARLGEQWMLDGKDYKKLRKDEGRPALTINKLPAFIRQVVNDARQNKYGIAIHPVDNGADKNTAEVISGLIRSIERMSSADVAYDTALEHAVTGGFGYFRIAIDYAHEDSFDLECRIERVPNPLMVHRDVSSTRFDAADWDYAFVSEFYTKDEFAKAFPRAEAVSFEAGSYNDDLAPWIEGDRIRVAEYWCREQAERELILFGSVDGDVVAVREDQLPIVAKAAAEAAGFDVSGMSDEELGRYYVAMRGLEEKRRRTVEFYEVYRRMMNGHTALDEQKWPGSTIPICPVYGDEVIVDGRRHLRSMVRDAKDPQMMFNFWRSASTELVALAPRAPWVGPQGFVPVGDQKWATANTQSHAYLEYDPSAGAPERQPFAGVPAGAIQEALNASDDMKAMIGIYDSSLGARSNETSGRAILARQREADVSNFHFIDNLARAIQYAGRVLVEIIPSVYSARQSVRILGDDQKEKVVELTTQDGGGVDEEGKPLLYNLTVGKYDVTVESGPSYSTQREETREFLIEIMRQVPGAAEFLGDIALDHMDFQGADKAAERLRTAMMMKGVIPPEGGALPMGQPGVGPEAVPMPLPMGAGSGGLNPPLVGASNAVRRPIP